MFIIYTDEAGTSANEAVTVVAGFIVEERDIKSTIQYVEDLFDGYVPARYRPNFEFHAYKVWGDPDLRDGWDVECRADFIAAMASVPRLCESALTITKVRRDSSVPKDSLFLSRADFQHLMAFNALIMRADKYVRDWGPQDSLAIVVAEDLPGKRELLRRGFKAAKTGSTDLALDERHLRLTAEEKASGRILQTNAGKAERVVDTVHFATRDLAVLLQVADACAFVFRRYLNAQSQGSEWIKATLGQELVWDDWQGPSSEVTFNFNFRDRG